MTRKFSQTLRDQLKAYFEKRHSLTISDEKADEYFDSLVNLCLAFSPRSPMASSETRFPKETYKDTSTPRVGVKVEAREARTTLTP